MNHFSLNFGYLFVQIFSLLMIICWLILIFYTLFALKGRKLSALLKVLWTFLILTIPIFGAIAFLIIQPTENDDNS
ncbi:MAG: hypothetical protein ABFD29_10890 [Anaerolineaceae bacterium]